MKVYGPATETHTASVERMKTRKMIEADAAREWEEHGSGVFRATIESASTTVLLDDTNDRKKRTSALVKRLPRRAGTRKK